MLIRLINANIIQSYTICLPLSVRDLNFYVQIQTKLRHSNYDHKDSCLGIVILLDAIVKEAPKPRLRTLYRRVNQRPQRADGFFRPSNRAPGDNLLHHFGGCPSARLSPSSTRQQNARKKEFSYRGMGGGKRKLFSGVKLECFDTQSCSVSPIRGAGFARRQNSGFGTI
jgi:hypothetical protein